MRLTTFGYRLRNVAITTINNRNRITDFNSINCEASTIIERDKRCRLFLLYSINCVTRLLSRCQYGCNIEL